MGYEQTVKEPFHATWVLMTMFAGTVRVSARGMIVPVAALLICMRVRVIMLIVRVFEARRVFTRVIVGFIIGRAVRVRMRVHCSVAISM